jgi:NADH-quinone oxidoreductase subunit J
MTLLALCLLLAAAAVLLLGLMRDLLYSALALALASVLLAVVLFLRGANIAAVFELSVCAGLITVLFVSTVSLTKDSDQKDESPLPRTFILPMAAILLGVAWFAARFVVARLPAAAAAPVPGSFADAFWGLRATDLAGQIALILVGVFGMLATLRTKDDGRRRG